MSRSAPNVARAGAWASKSLQLAMRFSLSAPSPLRAGHPNGPNRPTDPAYGATLSRDDGRDSGAPCPLEPVNSTGGLGQ